MSKKSQNVCCIATGKHFQQYVQRGKNYCPWQSIILNGEISLW
jgi:hypothetical protein